MPILPFSDLMLEGIEWKKELSEKQRVAVELLLKAFGETYRLQSRALNLSGRAIKVFSGEEGTLRDLEWLKNTLADGLVLIGHMWEYLDMLELFHPGFDRKFDRGEAERRLNLFAVQLSGTRKDLARKYKGAFIGPFGGDPEHRKKIVDWLISEQKKMLMTLKTGRWPERNRVLEWW